jgi:hypothetical protein
LDRRLGGPQSWSGHGAEQKNFQPVVMVVIRIITVILTITTTVTV